MADPTSNFPAQLPVKELRKTHPEYDANKLEKYQVLYEAGSKFRDHVEDFLVKRDIEKTDVAGPHGARHWANRKEKAWYIPRGPGLIDWLVAEMFKRNPRFIVKGGSAASKKYWEGLNEDCDGLGTNFAALARRTGREILLHGRGCLGLDFPAPEGKPSEPETLDARWKLIGAQLADDWECNPDGTLQWLRVHSSNLQRSAPWLQPDTQLECWRYYTGSEVFEYEYKRPTNASGDGPDATAAGVSYGHDFKVPPVFPVRASAEMWIMERVFDILVALFNREVSITWALDQLAYCLLVLKLENQNDISKIVAAEIAALKIGPSDDVKVVAPPVAIFDPLFRDSERLTRSLYEVIQTLAINAAATQTQNARQSAQAKQLDRDPLQTLLASFTWPIRDTIMQAVTALKRHRKEENLDVQLEGMDVFTATLEELEAQVNALKPGEKKPAAEPAKEQE